MSIVMRRDVKRVNETIKVIDQLPGDLRFLPRSQQIRIPEFHREIGIPTSKYTVPTHRISCAWRQMKQKVGVGYSERNPEFKF